MTFSIHRGLPLRFIVQQRVYAISVAEKRINMKPRYSVDRILTSRQRVDEQMSRGAYGRAYVESERERPSVRYMRRAVSALDSRRTQRQCPATRHVRCRELRDDVTQ